MWAVLVVAAICLALSGHAAVSRLRLRADRVTRFLFVGSAAGLLLIGACAHQYGLLAIQTVAATLAYAFACELYIFLFTMTISSVSANLLVRLLKSPLSETEIERDHGGQAMVAARLDRLVEAGFLARRVERLSVTPKGLAFANGIRRLRGVFRHG